MAMTQLRQLGTSSVKVSPMIFGAWAIGGWMWGGSDDNDAIAAIHSALDHGVTTIDTAAIYGMGHSEILVGKAIKGRRDKVIVATKCGMRWDTEEGTDPWPQKDNDGKDVIIRKNSKPASIVWECEQSLKRLGIETIDLFQIHWPDSSTPIEGSIRAMEKLRQSGKINAFGVSNYNLAELKIAKGTGPLASVQPPYSAIQRNIEKDILPWCLENHIGVICYSPLERGLLTGAVGPERKFPASDHRSRHKFFTVENRKRVADALGKIKPVADAHQASFAQIMIQWTISEPGITAAIVGARNAEQAEHNAKAMSISLTDEERAKIRGAFDECAATMAR
jgi:aryl-alcohol dehydrogenase-like predicted oxidoreductase